METVWIGMKQRLSILSVHVEHDEYVVRPLHPFIIHREIAIYQKMADWTE